MRCNRCDFAGEWEDLVVHAVDAGHPLCVVCAWSLRLEDTQTCTRCVGRARADLADVQAFYADLPEASRALPPTWHGEGTSRSHERPLPGGDALVLLAPGGSGSDLPSKRGNRDHAADELPSDAPSVLAVLATWEDDFRGLFGHPAAGKATLEGCAGYLSAQLGRAAREHPAFDEFAGELRNLRGRMARTVGADDRPIAAPADCFDCGGRLVRPWEGARACGHRAPSLLLLRRGDRRETPEERDARVAAWERAHARCRQGGVADDWECRACGRTYTASEYLLACRAKAEGADATLTPEQIQLLYGLRPATLRKWASRGLLGPVEGRGNRFRVADVRAVLEGRGEASA